MRDTQVATTIEAVRRAMEDDNDHFAVAFLCAIAAGEVELALRLREIDIEAQATTEQSRRNSLVILRDDLMRQINRTTQPPPPSGR